MDRDTDLNATVQGNDNRTETTDMSNTVNAPSTDKRTVISDVSHSQGRSTFHSSMRSVLSHPMCLPLMYFMYEEKPHGLPLDIRINREELFDTFKQKFDSVLEDEWNKARNRKDKVHEATLTTNITKRLNNMETTTGNLPFQAQSETVIDSTTHSGKIDIILFDRTFDGDTDAKFPFMVFEFGMNHNDWWSKFEQCTQYTKMLYKQQEVKTDQPILCVVITIDPNESTNNGTKQVITKMGVFFCRPKWVKNISGKDSLDLRVSLIWNSKSDDLKGGAKQFGKILEVGAIFQSLRRDEVNLSNVYEYEYFSSNCCKIGNMVCIVCIKNTLLSCVFINISKVLKSAIIVSFLI
jgi:hypothetical protein